MSSFGIYLAQDQDKSRPRYFVTLRDESRPRQLCPVRHMRSLIVGSFRKIFYKQETVVLSKHLDPFVKAGKTIRQWGSGLLDRGHL